MIVSPPPSRRESLAGLARSGAAALTRVALVSLTAIAPAAGAPPGDTGGLTDLSRSLQELSARVSPAVVQIHSSGYAPSGADARGADGLLAPRVGSGSGVVLDPEGFIVTNAHVVVGALRIQVLLSVPAATGAPGRSILKPRGELLEAEVVGADAETDLAVIKVEKQGLATLSLGDSDALRPGQLVLALGSPLGLDNSVSMGVVSAVGRQLRPEHPVVYIQTDAPINPGNSGGPLVDVEGKVVGINTFILSQSGGDEGVGFAVPSNIVLNVYRQIRESGRVRRGVIGVNAQTITPALAAGLGLPRSWGVLLGDVTPGGPGDRFGLEIGDVILEMDGKPMENGRQFNVNLYARRIGERVRLRVLRGGRTLEIEVPVMERREDPDRFASLVTPSGNLVSRLGVLGMPLDSRLLGMLPNLRRHEGVLVAATQPSAPHWRRDLRPGDVIYRINGAPVRDLEGLRAALDAIEPGRSVVLQVERDQRLLFVAIELD